METLFPFGFPPPTAVYLTFYVLTGCVYSVLMCHVLAGSGYLLVTCLRSRGQSREGEPDALAQVLRDWLPAFLGFAITAGVAPLLFLQILYREAFYSANLLQFHRWMSFLPVLILAYYLLYLAKSRYVFRWSMTRRVGLSLLVFACFAFTALAWTENHLLGLDREAWPDMYASGSLAYHTAELWPRLALWLAASLPALAMVLGWQIHIGRVRLGKASVEAARARLVGLGLGGALATAVFSAIYAFGLGPEVRESLFGPLAAPYVAGFGAGLALQALAWLMVWTRRSLRPSALWIATLGVFVSSLSGIVIREARRLVAIDITELYEAHRRASEVGGLVAFLVFFTANALLLGMCLLIARSAAPGRVRPS